jgi:photosystem II stability/assembly factor-like uncharacterized protein
MKTPTCLFGLIVLVVGCGETPAPVVSKPSESASTKAQSRKVTAASTDPADPVKEKGGFKAAAAKAAEDNPAGRWVLQASGVTEDLKDVQFLDAQLGFVVGHGNTILRTTDGGQTWKRLLPPKPVELRQVFFVSPKVGWVCTSLVGTILHTTDGGDSWAVVKLPGPEGVFSPRGNNFGSQTAVGNRYWLLYWGQGTRLQYTDDTGKEWKEIKLPFKFPDAAGASISFADLNHGCVAWKGQTEARCAFTRDGGQTWTVVELDKTQASGNYMMVRSADAQTAFALPHAGTIHATTDGGKTWTPHDMGHPRTGSSLNDLHFADTQLGHVLIEFPKAEVRRTRDGGKAWASLGKLQNPSYVHGVSFPDRKHGWVVGDKGYIEHYEEK